MDFSSGKIIFNHALWAYTGYFNNSVASHYVSIRFRSFVPLPLFIHFRHFFQNLEKCTFFVKSLKHLKLHTRSELDISSLSLFPFSSIPSIYNNDYVFAGLASGILAVDMTIILIGILSSNINGGEEYKLISRDGFMVLYKSFGVIKYSIWREMIFFYLRGH